MKKLLLVLGLSLLLTACEEGESVEENTETTVEEPAQKVSAPEPFYLFSVETDGRMVGGYEINTDPVVWLSATEGTCLQNSSETVDGGDHRDAPMCNPNGFLIVNETTNDTAGYMVPDNTPVYVRNLATVLGMEYTDSEEGTPITFEQLAEAFEENPDFFKVTPFILEFGTVNMDGLEMSDQITVIKEIYIP